MDSVRERSSHRGGFSRIRDQHSLRELGYWPHPSGGNRLSPSTHEMRTRAASLDATVRSSYSMMIEPVTRASRIHRPEAVEPSPASDRQPRHWTTSRPTQLRGLGAAR